MTPRESRKQRREAERQVRKAESRCELESRRAEMNRANAQFSTGPSTPDGKAKSSQNSWKHGLYSKQFVLPGEDPAELDELRASLRAEHQPANDTEAILVNELAEQFWRIRRMRRLEAETFTPEKLADWYSSGFLGQIQRMMTAAERGFHKALATLRQLQAARGFVPQNSQTQPETGEVRTGFVSQIHNAPGDSAAAEPLPPGEHSPEVEIRCPELPYSAGENPRQRDSVGISSPN